LTNTHSGGHKPALNPAQIWNMSFGFLGIQIGFDLQNGNVSRIFQTLGAEVGDLAILWIAAPMTGLIVQPIIGHLSDKTWGKFGRRRPYFLAGALLATFALFVMPNSPTLWVAAGMLWIMDASLNITMEPFRAFVGDNLPDRQRTVGYAMQSFFIGVGAVVAGALPWVMTNWLGLSNVAPAGEIPQTVQWAFYIGGAALLAAVAWTVFTSKEYSPGALAGFEAARRHELGLQPAAPAVVQRSAAQFRNGGLAWIAAGLAFAAFVVMARSEARPAFLGDIDIAQELYVLAALLAGFGVVQLIASVLRGDGRNDSGFMEVVSDLFAMPKTMRQLAVVQFFTWMGLFCMWIFFSVAVARNIMGATDTDSKLYKDGIDLANNCFAVYNLVAFLAAMALLWIGRVVSAKWIHFFSLLAGGLGLASVGFVRDPVILQWVSFSGIGIAWASILSMPYAMLSASLPANRMGVYMGIFNFFIVIPQILVAIVLSRVMENFESVSRLTAVVIGGVCMLIAAGFTLLVKDDSVKSTPDRI
jgi:maltose/moltooligosaccharide transporter